MPIQPRALALDLRTQRKGEVMAKPSPPGRKNYWLRPVGGGTEWEVPREFLQLLDAGPEPR